MRYDLVAMPSLAMSEGLSAGPINLLSTKIFACACITLHDFGLFQPVFFNLQLHYTVGRPDMSMLDMLIEVHELQAIEGSNYCPSMITFCAAF